MLFRSGDSALQEALVLAHFCKEVLLVHRGAKFRARQHFVDAVAGRANIKTLWNSVAETVQGDQSVNKVRVRNVAEGKTSDIECAGFFAYIGLEPACDFAPADVKRDAGGFIVADAGLNTGVPGLFAAGAVRAGFGGQLTHAIADGETAAKSVYALLGG